MENKLLSDIQLENIKYCALLLGSLLIKKPDDSDLEAVLAELRQLDSIHEWPFGKKEETEQALCLIKERLDTSNSIADMTADYQQLFIGPFSLKAPPWSSAYLDYEGVLFGSSTLELRAWMRKNGITTEVPNNEPEDHIGYMFLLLSWLTDERPNLIEEFISQHLAPWSPRFCEKLKAGAKTPFYQGLALLTKTTIESIVEAFSIKVATRPLYR